jgi:transposase
LKTTDYLAKYYALQIDVESIYRYMDTLYNTQKEAVQQISYQHTKQILGDEIRMVFYDVTTLYFEIEKEDTLRKTGFSKDGKHQNPQIVLGLLVSANAYPLAYDIFEGNKYEGDTMLPIIDSFRLKYSFETLTIVADSGLISERNIQDLEERGYKYILGARIKNQPRSIEEQIHALDLRDGECQIIWKDPGTALVISFSARRARKDYFNRERGLKRLEKQIISGKLTKSSINKRGYNKYLKLEGEMDISIDREKFDADGKWDGLKGYQTNDKSLSGQQVMDSYRQLWKIEKAFRISKHDLKIRPIYHRVQRRITDDKQALPLILSFHLFIRLLFLLHFNAILFGQVNDRIGVAQSIVLHHKMDGITGFSRAEILIDLFMGHYEKGRRLFVGKGGKGTEIPPGFFELYKIPDHIDNVNPVLYFLNRFVA